MKKPVSETCVDVTSLALSTNRVINAHEERFTGPCLIAIRISLPHTSS